MIAWCRMTENDVEAALETGVERVHLSTPVSDRQIWVKFATDRQDVIARVRRVVRYARNRGLVVSVGGEDASRADLYFLLRVVAAAEELGRTASASLTRSACSTRSRLMRSFAAFARKPIWSWNFTGMTIWAWRPRIRSRRSGAAPPTPASACWAWANAPATRRWRKWSPPCPHYRAQDRGRSGPADRLGGAGGRCGRTPHSGGEIDRWLSCLRA